MDETGVLLGGETVVGDVHFTEDLDLIPGATTTTTKEDQLDCVPIFEVFYEELDAFRPTADDIVLAMKDGVKRTLVFDGKECGSELTATVSALVIDQRPESSSISTESEESGVTSPVFHYEEELDSLSLCSSTSVVDDKEDVDSSSAENVLGITETPAEPQTPLAQTSPEQTTRSPKQATRSPESPANFQMPEQLALKCPVALVTSKTAVIVKPVITSLATPSTPPPHQPEQEKFRRQNIRSSILKRLTISWKREYDFQLESDRSFAEEEILSHGPEDCQLTGPITPPLRLPASGRDDLRQDEILRRHVLASIIDSENSYIDSLFKLVKEYQEPLRKSTPPVLSETKIAVIFSKIPQILQLHLQLRAALAELFDDWKYEKLGQLGNIFRGLFSKSYVSDVYAAYVCNFATALDTAKKAQKDKPAFAEFLRSKQELSKDRLPLFGLLVKPVQRFPQFILLLQDLLKHTPSTNDERISLQLALTHLEALTDSLNERKREHEQEKSARDVMRWAKIPVGYRISGTGGGGGDAADEATRRVLAEDDFKELELTAAGGLVRMKSRRLFLLNDLLICAAQATDRGDRLTPLWIVNIADVEVIDEKPVKFLGYQVASGSPNAPGAAAADGNKTDVAPPDAITKIFQDMTDLRQDYESFKRISDIVEQLKFDYTDLRLSRVKNVLGEIQSTIQVKMEEAARSDDCTFQILIPSGRSKNQKTRIVLQAGKWKQKVTWIILIHLSKLIHDKRLNPSWDDPDVNGISSPLFFIHRSLQIQQTLKKSTYKCGCYCFGSQKEDPSSTPSKAPMLKKPPAKAEGLVYLCSSDGTSSKVAVLSVEGIRNGTPNRSDQPGSIELLNFNLPQSDASCCEWIPGVYEVDPKVAGNVSLLYDSVWIGTEGGSVLIFLASAKVVSLGSFVVGAPVRSISFNYDKVYVALADSTLNVYRRSDDGCWNIKPYAVIRCSESGPSLRCVETGPNRLICAVGNEIVVINCVDDSIQSRHQLRKASDCQISRLARCGSGLWVAYEKSYLVSLFHVETFKFLQEVNVASNINRVLAERESDRSAREIFVTSLLAIRGSLWVGTNVGLVLTVSLPKLDGVPITLSRPTVSFHAHLDSASLLMALQPRTVTRKPPPTTVNGGSGNNLQARLSVAPIDLLDGHYRSFRKPGLGNQLVLRMWSDDSPDINSLYDALMRGSSSSEESINMKDQVRYDARRRRSLPSIPAAVEAETHIPRPPSFLRNSEHNSFIIRPPSGVLRPFSMIHDGSDWSPYSLSPSSKLSSRDSDYLDSCSRTTAFSEDPISSSSSNKPKFVKAVREKSRNASSAWWHSTLLVISAGSGYQNWRGDGSTDKDNSQLCLLGWEMRV
ncbi:Rho guanine nucleotide exchange factor 10 [Hypsibius exemplaris]|uniref:Rho guanine nucleotide exchange factor 10 n=1 Tax=Hypsibius exemplaris TaxID=2072580 RepID=A0A1W0WZ98_HYPEX|nr:Rho guanine nucleotide exchange factor 10 [Hypsibius exemplaris]